MTTHDPNKIVYSYTRDQAIQDGTFIDLSKLTGIEPGPFDLVTRSLLERGYFLESGKIDLNALNMLLKFCTKKLKSAKQAHPDIKHDIVEHNATLNNREETTLYLVLNETGKYTIMLPFEY